MVSEKYLQELKSQKFGIEIEFSFITRPQDRAVIRDILGNHEMLDCNGRKWSVKYDSSIGARRRNAFGGIVNADEEYQVEFVSPILGYEDLELLLQIVGALQRAGAEPSDMTGIHIHVSEEGHTVKSLRNLLNLFMQKEILMREAFQIDKCRLDGYCRWVQAALIPQINRYKAETLEKLQNQWYGEDCDRYRMLNLCSFFDNKGIEFRMFNATLDGNVIKAYIVFCLAISQKAKTIQRAVPIKSNMENNRYEWRNFLNRLGLAGDEFKGVRKELMRYVSGDAAFHNPEEHGRHRLIRGSGVLA